MEEKVKSFRSCARNLQFTPMASGTVEARVREMPTQQHTTVVEEESRTIEAAIIDEHSCPSVVKSPSEEPNVNVVSTPPLLIFNAGSVTPKKVRKFKSQVRKKIQGTELPVHVEDCCSNRDIQNNSSLKRKQADDMVVDNSVDLTVGLKKSKNVSVFEVGSAEKSVEAEVGQDQPRQAL